MPKININLQPSKFFFALITMALTGSCLCLYATPFSFLIKLLLTLFTVIYGFYLYRHACHYKKLTIDAESLTLTTSNKTFLVQLLGESTITRRICILRFIIPGNRIKGSCVIFQDSVTPQQFRRLLVLLQSMKLHGISSQNTLPSATF